MRDEKEEMEEGGDREGDGGGDGLWKMEEETDGGDEQRNGEGNEKKRVEEKEMDEGRWKKTRMDKRNWRRERRNCWRVEGGDE
jgi:hypothetical protein